MRASSKPSVPWSISTVLYTVMLLVACAWGLWTLLHG